MNRHNPEGEPTSRDDGYGYRVWELKGQLHRLDGPAVEWPSGRREWWANGLRHRTDGPALEKADGSRLWYQDGLLHREDGPAVEYADGTREWWVKGRRYSREAFNRAARPNAAPL